MERVYFFFSLIGFLMVIVSNMLRTVISTNPVDLAGTIFFLANKIAPAHDGLELGLGDASIIKALAEAWEQKKLILRNYTKQISIQANSFTRIWMYGHLMN